MQSSSEQPLVGEENGVTTRITAAKETMLVYDPIAFQFNKNVHQNKKINVLEFLSDKCLRTSRRKSRLGLPKVNCSKDFHFFCFSKPN